MVDTFTDSKNPREEEYDLSNQTEKYVNKCRVKIHAWIKSESPKDLEPESGKEYPIMEQTYKRDKIILKKQGTIKIDQE